MSEHEKSMGVEKAESRDAIRKARNRLYDKLDALDSLEHPYDVCEEAVAVFRCAREVRIDLENSAGPTVKLEVYLDSMDELTELLRWFGTKGIHQQGTPLDITECTPPFRSYTMAGDSGRIIMFAHFSTGGTCQYVKVGEKTEPVYELKCE